jgi:hypothetical protein
MVDPEILAARAADGKADADYIMSVSCRVPEATQLGDAAVDLEPLVLGQPGKFTRSSSGLHRRRVDLCDEKKETSR